MNKTIICAVMLILIAGIASADNPGAIWTTNGDCGDETQNVNHYAIGGEVHINGDNFNPGVYDWAITGQPGQASCDPNIEVASGSITINSSAAFCIHAYTVQVGDCGEYKANVGNKNDNYGVDEPATTTTTTTTSTTSTTEATTTTTTTTIPTTTSTTTTQPEETTTTTIPTAPEFGFAGMPLAALLIAPAFAYLAVRRKE